MHTKTRLLLQLPLTLVIIAFIPGNAAKLAALLLMWVLTFGKLSKPEAILYAAACLFFTAMNAASLKQGIFAFTEPDVLGMPVYELFMWGFYLLHTHRVLVGKPPAQGSKVAVWVLALLYSAAFGVIKDSNTLLMATGVLLLIGLVLFHERDDLSYTAYLLVFGALMEYTGVHSGQWSYPGDPPGGVPLWFITLWGGVGLFLRRLVVPILARYQAPAIQAQPGSA